MFQAFYTLIFTLAGLGFTTWLILRVLSWYASVWKNRNIEPPTKDIPACCPECGGNFGKWSAIAIEHRPNDPGYPLTGGTHEHKTQTRTCEDCGYGFRRVL